MFDKSRWYTVFAEADPRAMTPDYRIRPRADIDRLISGARTRHVIFKPLNESQVADQFLGNYPGGRVIWLYRNVHDTANSAVRKWGISQATMMTTIGRALAGHDSLDAAIHSMQNCPGSAMYAHRLNEDTCQKLVSWTSEPIDENTGAAILWYVRNQIFFDLDLPEHGRAILMQYERFVSDPVSETRRVCEWLGGRFSRKMVRDIHQESVGRNPPPDIARAVLDACVELAELLDRCESLQRAAD